MQVQIGVTLDASPALVEALSNLTAALTADSTIARAARTPRTTKKDTPPEPSGKSASEASASANKPGGEEKSSGSDAPTGSAEKTEPAAEAPGKSAPAAESPPPAAASSPASGSASAATTSPSSITREQIRVALGKLAQTDKAKALAILSENGATSVTTLAVEKYPAVLAAATA